MKVVGLGGPPGSGKSAVAGKLAQRPRTAWVELDRVAWDCYRPGSDTFHRLAERFGESILSADGTIDRARLAEAAFASDRSQGDLEAIVHPAVTAALRRLIEERRAGGDELLLVEGALLGISAAVDYALFDVVLWLDADEAVRRDRLAREGRREHARRWTERAFVIPVRRIDAARPLGDVAAAIRKEISRLAASADGSGDR
ncbi:MAG: dephospho-CoA kinase [Candidatus Bipolaricaulota bacterium]|nr:MAG: dephospho-CoA kinase [Candidatus Bipolaricaulota bacterium]